MNDTRIPLPRYYKGSEHKHNIQDKELASNLNQMLYEIMMKSDFSKIYGNDNKEHSLSELLFDITDALTRQHKDSKKMYNIIRGILKESPEQMNTFKEVWDYLNTDNPKSKLYELLSTLQKAEDGKGLSTNDFTDLLFRKLSDDYTKEELDRKFNEIADDIRTTSNHNIPVISDEDESNIIEQLNPGDWYATIVEDE